MCDLFVLSIIKGIFCLLYRLSLIQLAVHDKVYILDLLMLFECLDAEHWDRLLDDVFGNPNLIKLGKNLITIRSLLVSHSYSVQFKSLNKLF